MFFGCQKLSKSCKSIFTPHTPKTSVQEGGGNRPFHPLPMGARVPQIPNVEMSKFKQDNLQNLACDLP